MNEKCVTLSTRFRAAAIRVYFRGKNWTGFVAHRTQFCIVPEMAAGGIQTLHHMAQFPPAIVIFQIIEKGLLMGLFIVCVLWLLFLEAV